MTLSHVCPHVAANGDTRRRAGPHCCRSRAAGAAAPAARPPARELLREPPSTVSISDDRVDVRYVLDQAEIPTVQERGLGRAEVLRAQARRGRARPGPHRRRPAGRARARPAPPRLTFPAGAGGLTTTRLELTLNAAVRDPRRVELQDDTFPGRVGWKAIVSAPGEGTAVRTRRAERRPHRRPAPLPARPPRRARPTAATASFSVAPGRRHADRARAAEGGGADERAPSRGRLRRPLRGRRLRPGRAAAAAARRVRLGRAPRALARPRQGDGRRLPGRHPRDRPATPWLLGATVTVTHTIGVFALGLVTLALSQYVLPEDLYPWLTLVSGLMVVAVGAGVLRSRLRRRAQHAHAARPPSRTTTTPHDHELSRQRPARHGRRRRPDPLPLRARGAARRDLAARGRRSGCC